MRTFKEFLTEARAPGSVPLKVTSLSELSEDELFAFIEEHCSKWLNLVKENTPIWRGDDSLSGACVIDTSESLRVSENTANYGTLLMDAAAKGTGFPMRSKSLIVSSEEHYAESFGTTFTVIPFNSAKVASVNKQDIFESMLKFPFIDRELSIPSANTFLRYLFLVMIPDFDKKASDLATFKGYLKTIGSKSADEIKKTLQDGYSSSKLIKHLASYDNFPFGGTGDTLNKYFGELAEFFSGDSFKKLLKIYSHDVMGHSIHLAGKSITREAEMWIEGSMVVMPYKTWVRFRKHLQGK